MFLRLEKTQTISSSTRKAAFPGLIGTIISGILISSRKLLDFKIFSHGLVVGRGFC